MAEKKPKGKAITRQKAASTDQKFSMDTKWRIYEVLITEHRHQHAVWMDNFRVILTFNSILLPGTLGVFALISQGNVTVGMNNLEIPIWTLLVLSFIGAFTTGVMMLIIR